MKYPGDFDNAIGATAVQEEMAGPVYSRSTSPGATVGDVICARAIGQNILPVH